MSNEELAAAVQAGAQDAGFRLWQQVQKLCRILIRAYAMRYMPTSEDLEDLQQESYFVVINTARKYNPEKGFKFTSWLNYGLKNRIDGYLGTRGNSGRTQNIRSLDEPLAEDFTLMDTLADEDNTVHGMESAHHAKMSKAIRAALETLPERQRIAIDGRYLNGRTLKDIAAEVGISLEAVRQHGRKGLRSLRKPKYRHLRSFICDDDCYRHKSLKAFKQTHTSVIEDIVVDAIVRRGKEM